MPRAHQCLHPRKIRRYVVSAGLPPYNITRNNVSQNVAQIYHARWSISYSIMSRRPWLQALMLHLEYRYCCLYCLSIRDILTQLTAHVCTGIWPYTPAWHWLYEGVTERRRCAIMYTNSSHHRLHCWLLPTDCTEKHVSTVGNLLTATLPLGWLFCTNKKE